VFGPLQSNFEISKVPKDSQVPISRVWVSSSHFLKIGLRQRQGLKLFKKTQKDINIIFNLFFDFLLD